MDRTALAGRRAANELRAIGNRLFRMERAGFAGKALGQQLRIGINQNSH